MGILLKYGNIASNSFSDMSEGEAQDIAIILCSNFLIYFNDSIWDLNFHKREICLLEIYISFWGVRATPI